MLTALVRPPTPALARCALTFVERAPIDPERALAQHRAYVRALREAGARVIELPAAPEGGPELPDAPFVEDTAVVLDELAVLARPAGALRRREVPAVEAALARLGSVRIAGRIEPPATLEGGDVLRIGRRLWVGLSARTNAAGIRRLRELVAPHGYLVDEIPVAGALHLKTAVTFIPSPDPVRGRSGLLLANPDWVGCDRLRAIDPDLEILPVAPGEPFAANTLTVGGTLLVSAAHPETRRRLERRGLAPRPVDVSELEKAEAGLTCLSLIPSP